jgi:ABC-type amino acid transport system permease subunit
MHAATASVHRNSMHAAKALGMSYRKGAKVSAWISGRVSKW